MDERIRQAFIFAEIHLQQKIEFWKTNSNQDAIAHYQNELATLKSYLDDVIAK